MPLEVAKQRVLVVDDSSSILRVVEAVLAGAGYQVATQHDAASAAAHAVAFAPDLILLDFLMPSMDGQEVARRVRQMPELHAVPIILMCSKGDTAAERAVSSLGIVDYITKPFSPDAILALVSYTLDKRVDPDGTSLEVAQLQAASADAIAADQTQVHTLPPELMEEANRAAQEEARAATDEPTDEPETLHTVLLRTLTARLGRHAPHVDALRMAVDEALAQMPPAPEGPWGDEGKPALWGKMRMVPLPEVFQLMTLQGQTGLLETWVEPRAERNMRGPVRFNIYFSRGKVDFVTAANMHEDFLLGRFLVGRGAIERTELDGLLRARKGGKLLGQQLVALGYITPEQLHTALRDQCSELVYELLRMPTGTFCLRHGNTPPPEFGDVRLGIGVDELLLEGLRRVDEWGVVEKEIDTFDSAFELDRPVGDAQLTDDERYVLEHIQPGITVRELVVVTAMRPFDVCKVLYRLLMARHIRKM